ncbi:MAG: hypothetical protein CMJ31_07445 [Phycisphaerae bacterium]|nr:hypothetical protein [Phycisphaerae bacterium]
MFAKTGNPALSAFEQRSMGVDASGQVVRKTMTMQGTIVASGTLLAICVGAALFFWGSVVTPAINAGNLGSVTPWLFGSMIVGLVLSLVCIFAKKTCPFVGPVYAACEGVFVSAVSAVIPAWFMSNGDGPPDYTIIFQAVTITFGIFAGMLIAYGAGIVKATGVMAKMFAAGMIGVSLYFVVMLVGNLFLGSVIPNLWASTSPLGIGFSLLLVALASFSLVMDFELIKRGVNNGAPKYMEWYGAVGLLISLVWLYVEVLRLLAKLRRD